MPVLVGVRLWEPSEEEAFREAARRGLARLVLVDVVRSSSSCIAR